MSLKFRSQDGTETPVAGLNGTSGELVPSVALMQSGTVTCNISTSDNLAQAIVTFSTPMPDANYIINIEVTGWGGAGNLGTNISLSNKSKNGFTIRQYVAADVSTPSMTYKWQAFKLMTDEVHEADAAAIAQNTANFAPAFSETTSYAVGDYCTYNGILYRCTTAHTAGVWVAGHFTQVTVGGDLESLNPVELGYSTLTASDQTITLTDWNKYMYLLIEVRTQGICRGSQFVVNKRMDYRYICPWDYSESMRYATLTTGSVCKVETTDPVNPASVMYVYGIKKVAN